MKPTRQKSVGILLIAALCLLSAQSIVAQPFPSCPEGTTLLAKFEWRGNQYVFEKPEGNEDVVTIIKGTTSKIKFTSTQFIGQVILHGGRDHKVVEINDTEGKVTNEGMENRGGQTPDISNVQFCGVVPDPCPFADPPTVSFSVEEENGAFFLDILVQADAGVALTDVDITVTGTHTVTGEPLAVGLDLISANEQFQVGLAEYRYQNNNLAGHYEVVVDVEDACGLKCPIETVPQVVAHYPGDGTGEFTITDDHPIVTFDLWQFFQTHLIAGPTWVGETSVSFAIRLNDDAGQGWVGVGILAANACNALVYDPPIEGDDGGASISMGAYTNQNLSMEVPAELQLGQNYPNPFNPMTSIAFGLPEAGQVTLTVYDLLGREVAVLVDGVREAGSHQVMFEAGHLSGGTYIYRLTAGGTSITKKLLLLK